MLQGIIDLFGGFGKLLVSFISTIVIPGTVMFTVVRMDLSAAKNEIVEIRSEVRTDREEAKEEAKLLSKKFDLLTEQLLKMNRSMGRVEGELARIGKGR